ncbi:MAG: polyphosphate kinase 1 [Deltaproteobacteria bacterium]|nr:polyphosphate kinase 1 [Deltaproteobacteria bacterium]
MVFPFKASPKLRPLLADPTRPFIHRDLSWLQFNARVLAEADLDTNPLLERVKFLSISSSNLDEFFMIRMAALGRSIAGALRKNDEPQLRRLRRIRSVILGSVEQVIRHQAKTLELLTPKLSEEGIHIISDPRATGTSYALGKQLFNERVLPELVAPTPYAPNQLTLLENVQMAAIFEASNLWVKLPRKLKSVMSIRDDATGSVYIFFLDWLLATYLAPAFNVEGDPVILRLTRDSDVTVELEEEDTESIPDVVLTSLRTRERGRPMRLQYHGKPSRDLLRFSHEALKLNPQQIFEAPATVGLHRLWSVLNEVPEEISSKPGLTHAKFTPLVPALISAAPNIFELLQKSDVLLHHPYDSFDSYVQFIRAAAQDTAVTSIQQTVYRMDALSPVIDLLKQAAQTGKAVRVLIELRARFDELNNLRLTDELRKAGIEVYFGFGKLKLHAKIALITRLENGVERYYTHLSTGNYHAVTARLYTDLAILSANQDIGEDARHFFEAVRKSEIPSSFKRLVPAPMKLHRRIIQLIDAEIAAAKDGKPARIFGKVNSLVDEEVIERLYGASQSGVKIDLVVRGACSLVPGVRGLSENIRVISIIDRFLEHSRIYYFESSKALYLSSADWMPRNFFSRLELAYPVLDDAIYRYLVSVVIPTYLADTVKSHELTSDGTWETPHPVEGAKPIRSQFYLEELTRNEYEGTPLDAPGR